MYRVYYGREVLYEPTDVLCALSAAELDLNLGCAGSFCATVPKTNPLIDSLKECFDEVRIERDGKTLFCGRIIEIKKNFLGDKTITCEGDLAYLLDSIQPQHEFHDISPRAFLAHLIAEHNAQMKDSSRAFKLGAVIIKDKNDSLYRYTNYESTLEAIQDKLTERLGGFLRVRHEKDGRYLDCLDETDHKCSQKIVFGENLLDVTENLHIENLATRVIPLGARLDESPIKALDAYTTINSVNNNKPYLESKEAVERYGVLCKTVHFDDVTEPANLKKKAERYLKDTQFAEVAIQVAAVDLHLADADIQAFSLGDEIDVISSVHGMDRSFVLSELKLDLLNPESTTLTLGKRVQASLSQRSVKDTKNLASTLERMPSQAETLSLARDNATQLITSATSGYVTTRSDEVLVMDDAQVSRAKRIWRWNLNGLGYSNHGYKGPYQSAITMDGSIVADFITTGTLNADLIKAGTLKDKNSTIVWNLSTGKLVAKCLSIDAPNFKLTESGVMSASSARLSGTITTETTSTKTTLGSGKLRIFYANKELGTVGGNGFADLDGVAGLNFDLESTGDYMTWAVQNTAGENYHMIWTYSRDSLPHLSAGCLNAGCDIDMHYYKLRNVRFEEGGTSGTISFCKANEIGSDGRVRSWNNNCYMEFKNGLLVSARF